MNILRTSTATVAAVLALGSLAACGSSSDDRSPAPTGAALPTVSKAVFAQRGNVVCRTSGQAIGSKFQAMSKPPKPAELTAAYDNMLKESYKVVGELLDIGAPKGQERELLDLIVQQYQVTADVEKQGQEKFFADQDSDPWADTVAKLVSDFGLKDCGHDG
ncbi:MAG: hypothetical protein ACJ716_07670 [Marmoricola sp.]